MNQTQKHCAQVRAYTKRQWLNYVRIRMPRLKENITKINGELDKHHKSLSELYSQGVISGYTKQWFT